MTRQLGPLSAGGQQRRTRIGTVTVIDVNSNKVVNTIDVGQTPEHLTLSHNGKYFALTIGNGSSSRPGRLASILTGC